MENKYNLKSRTDPPIHVGYSEADIQTMNLANEQARANEIHKLELEIYLVPRKSIRADQPPKVQQEIIEKNNKQREEFQKRVKEI